MSKPPLVPVTAARAAVQLGRTVSLALKHSDLTPAAYRTLAYLVTGEYAARVLAAKLMVSRPTVTAVLDWLEPRGYVTRTQGISDRREIEIAITEKGRIALEEADRLVGERLMEVVALLEPARAADVVSVLDDLGRVLNVYRARDVDPATGRIRDSMT